MELTRSARIGNIKDVVAVLLVTSVAAATMKQRTRFRSQGSKCVSPESWFPIHADNPDT